MIAEITTKVINQGDLQLWGQKTLFDLESSYRCLSSKIRGQFHYKTRLNLQALRNQKDRFSPHYPDLPYEIFGNQIFGQPGGVKSEKMTLRFLKSTPWKRRRSQKAFKPRHLHIMRVDTFNHEYHRLGRLQSMSPSIGIVLKGSSNPFSHIAFSRLQVWSRQQMPVTPLQVRQDKDSRRILNFMFQPGFSASELINPFYLIESQTHHIMLKFKDLDTKKIHKMMVDRKLTANHVRHLIGWGNLDGMDEQDSDDDEDTVPNICSPLARLGIQLDYIFMKYGYKSRTLMQTRIRFNRIAMILLFATRNFRSVKYRELQKFVRLDPLDFLDKIFDELQEIPVDNLQHMNLLELFKQIRFPAFNLLNRKTQFMWSEVKQFELAPVRLVQIETALQIYEEDTRQCLWNWELTKTKKNA